MTRRIAVIAAGLSDPSSTRLLADRLSEATASALAVRGEQVDTRMIELRPLAHDISNAMLTGFATGALRTALDAVAAADAVIAVTPVFQASYSGLFKSFVDVIDRDALSGTPVLIGATAGTARHSLVLDYAMRPLFSYLHAVVTPTGVFAASEDWGQSGAQRDQGRSGSGATELSTRVDRAARELADLVVVRPTRTAADPFDTVVDFSTLLTR